MENTNHVITIGSVVVAVDGSPSAEDALVWAATEARLQKRELAIVHAVNPPSSTEQAWLSQAGISPRQVLKEALADARNLIDRSRTTAGELVPGLVVSSLISEGDPRDLLIDLAGDAAMIVLGSRGRGPVASLLLGSVSSAVTRGATCPVVVIRPAYEEAGDGGVLVGTDGSSRSLATVELAYREASFHGWPLTVVHCLWDPLLSRVRWSRVLPTEPEYDEARLRVAETLSGMAEKFPDVEVTVTIAKGSVDTCLIDMSHHHELLVVGRHARTLSQRLEWGWPTTGIIEHAGSPVVVVP